MLDITTVRNAIAANGGTPQSFVLTYALRELVTAYGGTPTQWTRDGLLREAIGAAGGSTAIKHARGLIGELVTTLGGASGNLPDDLDHIANTAPTTFTRLNASAAATSAWNAPALTGVWQDTAGTVAGAAGQPIGKLDDLIGSRHLVAPSDAARPTATNGVTWGPADHRLDFPATIPANSTLIFIATRDTDAQGVLWGNRAGSPWGAIYLTGQTSSSVGAPGGAVFVDEVATPTRDNLYVALAGGSHIVEHRDTTADVSNPSVNSYTAGSALTLSDSVCFPVALLDTTQPDYADALVLARQYATEQKALIGV